MEFKHINDLAALSTQNGAKAIVYELCMNSISRQAILVNGYEVRFIEVGREVKRSDFQKAFDNIYKDENGDGVVFIIATDQFNVCSKASNVITIQHGIAHDTPGPYCPGIWKFNKFLQRSYKLLRCIKNARLFFHTKNTVCVDYNYFNWFRTLDTIYSGYKMHVVPNYASGCITEEKLNSKLSKEGQKRKVVFARRFVLYRGTLLFADVIEQLNKEGIIADFTFAGGGELEEYVKNRFRNTPNVHFTKFLASESIDFHSQFDIAIVPTIWSEGTSLSLSEAMAAGCYPICTHVGGMTNMILDGYNGRMCFPDANSVYNALKEALLLNQDNFNLVAKRAYMTSKISFSKKKWDEKWLSILMSVA